MLLNYSCGFDHGILFPLRDTPTPTQPSKEQKLWFCAAVLVLISLYVTEKSPGGSTVWLQWELLASTKGWKVHTKQFVAQGR